MRNLFLAISVSVCLLVSSLSSAQAAMDPKLKMVATMAGYGVVGGALLGTATLAFGSGGRSIAKGASIGLYAGLLFGGYILVNYEMKKRGYGTPKENYYPESSSPYEDESSYQLPALEDYKLVEQDRNATLNKDTTLFFMNFLNYQF